ncbi:hypothetical protein [Nocardioides convexus]|uniref:hypothetical protein n=1 Tax=Nocardioides convexus TaxID=2712224 RepID=UPI00241857CC|nr:hypothetical protein [Nocardioides convexus]
MGHGGGQVRAGGPLQRDRPGWRREEARRRGRRQDHRRASTDPRVNLTATPGRTETGRASYRRGEDVARGSARRSSLPFGLVLPATLVLGLALGYPLVRQVVLSLQEFGLAQQFGQAPTWIGLGNYRDLLGDGEPVAGRGAHRRLLPRQRRADLRHRAGPRALDDPDEQGDPRAHPVRAAARLGDARGRGDDGVAVPLRHRVRRGQLAPQRARRRLRGPQAG